MELSVFSANPQLFSLIMVKRFVQVVQAIIIWLMIINVYYHQQLVT